MPRRLPVNTCPDDFFPSPMVVKKLHPTRREYIMDRTVINQQSRDKLPVAINRQTFDAYLENLSRLMRHNEHSRLRQLNSPSWQGK